MRRRPRELGATMLFVMLAAAACAVDEAESLYLSALRGEDAGMSRAEQIELVTRAIALAPDRPNYYETRAIYQIDRQEFPDALGDVDRAIAIGDRPYLRFLRGLVLCQSQHPEQSIDDFDLAIGQQPSNLQFYRGRGLALAELGRFEAALADGEHLVSTAGHMAESHYVRGRALQGLGRHAEAVRDFTTAIAIRPELVYPLTARAASYAALGDDRAQADLAAAASVQDAHRRCAPCVDPFRY